MFFVLSRRLFTGGWSSDRGARHWGQIKSVASDAQMLQTSNLDTSAPAPEPQQCSLSRTSTSASDMVDLVPAVIRMRPGEGRLTGEDGWGSGGLLSGEYDALEMRGKTESLICLQREDIENNKTTCHMPAHAKFMINFVWRLEHL